MRILVSLRPFHGHLAPLAPTTHALTRNGHEIVVATAEPFREAVEAEGFHFKACGLDPRTALPHGEEEPAARDWGEIATRAKLVDLLELAERWRPDVIVREQTDFAALLAAEILDVPPVTLGPALFIPPRSWVKLQGDRLDRIRADYGIASDPGFTRLHPFLYLDVAPPSWQHPLAAQVDVLHRVRPVELHPRSKWERPETERPLAYATLGTVYNKRPDLLRALIEGAVDAGFYVVATTGPGVDPPQDPIEHAEVHAWLPQLSVIASSRLVLAHGGFSTVMTALAHGVPLVVVPLGSDNPVHARRCREHGVGIVLRARRTNRASVCAAAGRVFSESSWRQNARRLRAEIRTLPPPERAAELVELVGSERKPIPTRRRTRARRPRRGRTAAVIPSYGPLELAHRLLADIAREEWVEPVIVDNGGDYEPFADERILRPGRNLGWAGGCNHALRELADDGFGAFVLLNSDTRLSSEFFAGLWDAYHQTSARLLGPVYDGVWPYQHVEHRGAAADYRPRRFHREVPFLDGTCLFLPAETVREVGLPDAESFPLHGWGVDFDYALRVRGECGGQIVATELSFLHHQGNGTARTDGWRVAAWDELVSGMRKKWGQAWPSRLRAADARGPVGGGVEPTPANTCVVVLGAPSSGASLVARLVNMLGVAPPSVDAERELARLRGELTGDADWLPPLAPFELLGPASAVEMLDEARRALVDSLPERPWLWRDARNDFLLPFWTAALDVEAVVVLVLRDPVEVAESLQLKLGWPLSKGLAYWERSLRHALLNSVGLPVLVTRFEDVLDDPLGWCERTEAFLAAAGVPLLVPSDRRVLAETVQPELRHHRSATSDVLSEEQRLLVACAERLVGPHRSFPEIELPPETPTADVDLHLAEDADEDGPPSQLTEEWASWVNDNRRLGVSDAQLVQVLVERGIPPRIARRELDRVGNGWREPGYRLANRSSWNELVQIGATYTIPYGPYELASSKEILDAPLPLPWEDIETVLCLASGGGQQAPLFAALGKRVTLVDLSPSQLERDRESARLYKLDIECIEADMLDLGALWGRDFDLVYQPVSTCYVGDLRRLYAQVGAVLRRGGWYWSEHWNPVHMQLEQLGRWSGRGYRIVRPQQQDGPVVFTDENGEAAPGACWHFVHSLEDLIGNLGAADFAITGFAERLQGDADAEPGSDDHVCAFVPPLLTVLALRLDP